MKISTRIRTARVRVGMSQADLATALGVSRSAVANWESAKGRVYPSTERLGELAMATGVSYEWLATGRGTPYAPSDGIPAADAEFVDDPVERRLLEGFRACNEQFRQAILTVVEAQAPPRQRRQRPAECGPGVQARNWTANRHRPASAIASRARKVSIAPPKRPKE